MRVVIFFFFFVQRNPVFTTHDDFYTGCVRSSTAYSDVSIAIHPGGPVQLATESRYARDQSV